MPSSQQLGVNISAQSELKIIMRDPVKSIRSFGQMQRLHSSSKKDGIKTEWGQKTTEINLSKIQYSWKQAVAEIYKRGVNQK